jgi:HTH-type transcriptional regulator / antitoxin HipB
VHVTTVRDLGALTRTARRAQGLTQADLAQRLGVSREWIVRLEGGHPRLEAQKVLDALLVLGLTLDVEQQRGAAEAAPHQPVSSVPPGSTAVGQDPGAGPDSTSGPDAPVRKGAAKNSTSADRAERAARQGVTDPFESLFSKRPRP